MVTGGVLHIGRLRSDRSQREFHIKESERLGEWVGVRVGHRRPTIFGKAKEDVIAQVTKVLHEEGGGKFLVLNRTGKCTEIRQVRSRNRSRGSRQF